MSRCDLCHRGGNGLTLRCEHCHHEVCDRHQYWGKDWAILYNQCCMFCGGGKEVPEYELV